MEEQMIPERRRVSAVPIIAILAVVIVAGVLAYLFLGGPKGDPVRYIPKEVAVAATFDFTRSADKDAAMDAIRSIFKDAGVAKPDEDLWKSLGDELKLDFKKDVLAHLNGTGAAAVLTEMNGMMPSMVVAACTKSNADAETLMATLLKKLRENKVKFTNNSYKGFSYCRIPSGSVPTDMPFGGPQLVNYAGAVDGAVVWANSEGGFKNVVDTIKGQPSLLRDSTFARLRKTSPSTFSVMFFSGPGYYKLVSPYLNMCMGMAGGEVPPELKEQMENTIGVVCSADASGDGLKFSAVGLTKKPGPKYESLPLSEMAAQFPANAKIACSLESWDKMWGEFKKVVLSNSMVSSQVSQATTQAKQMMGFDPLADLLDRLTGFAAYYAPAKAANSGAFPGALTFALDTDKPDVMRKSLAKLHQFAGSACAVKVGKSSLDGYETYTIPLGADVGVLGDTLVGRKVVVTIAGSSIKQAQSKAIAASRGKGTSLADTDGFKLVKSQLPDKGMMFFYGDVGGIIDVFKADIPQPERKKVEAVFKHVGWFAAVGDAKGTESTSTMYFPFKK